MTVKVTAQAVADKQFTSVRWQLGYDEDEVDDFLDEIKETLDTYQDERDQMVQVLLADNLEIDLRRALLTILGVQRPQPWNSGRYGPPPIPLRMPTLGTNLKRPE